MDWKSCYDSPRVWVLRASSFWVSAVIRTGRRLRHVADALLFGELRNTDVSLKDISAIDLDVKLRPLLYDVLLISDR